MESTWSPQVRRVHQASNGDSHARAWARGCSGTVRSQPGDVVLASPAAIIRCICLFAHSTSQVRPASCNVYQGRSRSICWGANQTSHQPWSWITPSTSAANSQTLCWRCQPRPAAYTLKRPSITRCSARGMDGNMSHTLTMAAGLQLRHALTTASAWAGHCRRAANAVTATSSTLHSARNSGGCNTWATLPSQAARSVKQSAAMPLCSAHPALCNHTTWAYETDRSSPRSTVGPPCSRLTVGSGIGEDTQGIPDGQIQEP